MKPAPKLSGRKALLAGDVAAAVVLTTGATASALHLGSQPPPVPTVGFAFLCTTAVAWRRAAPAPAFLVCVSALVAYQLVSRDPNMAFEPYAVVLTAYMAGRRSPPWSLRLLFLCVYGLVAMLALRAHPHQNPLAGIVEAWVMCVVAAVIVGQLVARHHRLGVRLADVTTRLRREQDARAVRLAAQERSRVARELHDVTAHSVSVMVIQASAARLLALADIERARRALQVVVRSGREAMDDLRRTMGVLRRGEDDLVDCLPDDRGIEALVEQSCTAGLEVHLDVRGETSRLAAGVRFALYRVVQEALTNAAKHGGGGPTSVTLASNDVDVSVTITNQLRGEASEGQPLPSSGHGLVGMRERVLMLGGELSAGPANGAFRVQARLPATEKVAPARDWESPGEQTSALKHALAAPEQELANQTRLWLTDWGLAMFWLVALGINATLSSHRSGGLALNLAGVAAMALSGVWRRQYPMVFALLVGTIAIPMSHGLTSRGYGTLVGLYTVTVPNYTIGSWTTRRRAIAYLIVIEALAAVAGIAEHASSSGIAGPALLAAVAWLAGRAMRHERSLTERFRRASLQLAAEEEDHARLAVVAERARLARDLHGLVAREVSAMVIQAELAERLLGFDQRRLDETIEAIEDTGRTALSQMRTTLGVLRAGGELRPLSPQSGTDLAPPPLAFEGATV
jgi:signal transduction histidine kinase